MRLELKLGCNFDPNLLESIKRLNDLSEKAKVAEFYGSIRRHHRLTARPAFRLPDIPLAELQDYVARCRENCIGFDYMLNTPYLGSKKHVVSQSPKIVRTVRALEAAGVAAITVATPVMATLVREASPSVGLGVSTVAHINTVAQIEAWHEHYRINRVCVDLWKNRSIRFLKSAAAFCHENDIALTVLANEFCYVGSSLGGGSYGTHCIFRDSCYLCHAENITAEDDKLWGWYPMALCIESRGNLGSWLKARFIRPEDVSKYQEIGVACFKVTGRTGTTEYILRVAEAYLKGVWPGNLLELWKPLESIHSPRLEDQAIPPIGIPNDRLDGFVDFWFKNPDHECANLRCGVECRYCDEFWSEAVSAERHDKT